MVKEQSAEIQLAYVALIKPLSTEDTLHQQSSVLLFFPVDRRNVHNR